MEVYKMNINNKCKRRPLIWIMSLVKVKHINYSYGINSKLPLKSGIVNMQRIG